jgi:hypothetical protein
VTRPARSQHWTPGEGRGPPCDTCIGTARALLTDAPWSQCRDATTLHLCLSPFSQAPRPDRHAPGALFLSDAHWAGFGQRTLQLRPGHFQQPTTCHLCMMSGSGQSRLCFQEYKWIYTVHRLSVVSVTQSDASETQQACGWCQQKVPVLFWWNWGLNSGLCICKQALCPLKNTSSQFCSHFGDGPSRTIFSGWPRISILLISASQLAGITDVSTGNRWKSLFFTTE